MFLLPFSSNAGMISTGEVVMSAQDLANRNTVRDFIAREEVANQLKAMGLSVATAQDRVAAMTQDEVNRLAGQIETAPAGGAMAYAVIVALILAIVAVIVYFIWQDAK
ncbi:MAG: PA2779 family protein, partial [Betaproteobacteria bacterium]|nr:PA2779 family protein [Betaproteobacteria bacterium]